MNEIANCDIFTGESGKVSFCFTLPNMRDGKYKFAGQMLEWSIRQGGPGLPIFTPAMYKLLVGRSVDTDDVQYVVDSDVRQRLYEVCHVKVDVLDRLSAEQNAQRVLVSMCTTITRQAVLFAL